MGSIESSLGIQFNELKRIKVEGGDVLHGLKASDDSFNGFGEGYFSFIDQGAIKAWKKHTRMTMNLIVPVGTVHFCFLREESGMIQKEAYEIGENSYGRLTVPPGVWFGFSGKSKNGSLILNLSNIEHDPEEVERKDHNFFNHNWELK